VSWLAEQRIDTWSNLRFWTSGITTADAKLITNDKARAKGLVLRPLVTSAWDALEWYKAQPLQQQGKFLLLDGLRSFEESMERERSLLSAWHKDADIS